MASFHEIQFPVGVSQGAQGGMRFNTSVIPLSSGAEHRNINWVFSRGEWDVKHGLKTQEDIEGLVDFFAARRGKAYGFRFKDWSDYRLPRWRYTPGDMFPIPVQMTTDGGVTTMFQLKKVYTDAGGNYTRIIAKPQTNQVAVQMLDNGLPTTHFTVDPTTGIVTLTAPLSTTTGHTIAVACEFDVPVRFDTDDMKITTTTTEIYAWEAIPVVETREIS
jgi:uncharacterized protein (TIGR02217 family)